MHWKYQKWVFLGILWVKTNICIFVNPKKAPPRVQARVLTYYSPKSVNNCDLSDFSRNKKKPKKTDTQDVNVGVCWRSRL